MKLLFLNGSRGEWGYIRPIIDLCRKEGIDYGICATNMLLLPAYGTLVDEIKADGYNVSSEIFMSFEGNNHFTMTKSLGVFLSSFVDVLNQDRPDWLILAGDRGEQLMGATAGAYSYIPVAHIQAGERSGNIDGTARHAIGKFAHLHFAANQDAVERLERLGEEKFRIHKVGAPQLDELVGGEVSDLGYLTKKYGVRGAGEYLMVVQHPVTEEMDQAAEQVEALTTALNSSSMQKIWVLPNNDAGSHTIRQALLKFRDQSTLVFDNLTRRDYLGLLKNAAAIVGNSSSGLLEAPTFAIPAVNIGRRQMDRVAGANVINAEFRADDIKAALQEACSSQFRASVAKCENPYGDGHSSRRILDVLSRTPVDDRLLAKRVTY